MITFLINAILPMLLSVVLSSAVLSVYGVGYVSGYTILILLIALLFAALSQLSERKKLLGTVGFIAGFVAIIFLLSTFTRIGYSQAGMMFIKWVFEADKSISAPAYLMALAVGAPAFFTPVVYYFSNVLHRISYLTLVSLIPCVLYVKVTEEIDNVYLVIIASLNLAIHVVANRRRSDVKHYGGYRGYVSVAAFVLAVMLVSALIPKSDKTVFYDEFEAVFMKYNFDEQAAQGVQSNLLDLAETSGNADNYRNSTGRRLYLIDGDMVDHIKSQTFDVYDYERNYWTNKTNDDINYKTSEDWKDYSIKLDLGLLKEALSIACERDEFKDKYPWLLKSVEACEIEDSLRSARISLADLEATHFLANSRGVSVDTLQLSARQYAVDGTTYRVSPSGCFELANKRGRIRANANYTISFYDDIKVPEIWMDAGLSQCDDEQALQALKDARAIIEGFDEAELVDCLDAFIAQQNAADEYRKIVVQSIPDELVALAKELTNGLKYDYEKARAIEKYFRSSEFKYDVEYVPDTKGPVYFVNESKTGTCSDYATAFVLVARASGLNVRYAEGYRVKPLEFSSRRYEITDQCGHAYPEVFIQNLGWVVFEPTSSNVVIRDDSNGFLEFLRHLTFDFGLLSVIFIYSVLALILWPIIKVLIPAIMELVFRIRVKRLGDKDYVKAFYNRLAKGNETKTPAEFCDYMQESDIDIKLLVDSFESVEYSGVNSQIDRNALFELYKNTLKLQKKAKKIRKK